MVYKGARGMLSYDAMETLRNTNEWMGASARAIASYPLFAMIPSPFFKVMSAWGRVTERSFARMVIKPDWEIPPIAGEDGQDHVVYVEPVLCRAFGDLIHFRVARRDPLPRKVLLVAPMSGHYATLMRSTVLSLLNDCELYVTDWHNARDIPVSEGKFDIEDYTQYLVDFIRHLGPDTNIIAVCQPAPLALAACDKGNAPAGAAADAFTLFELFEGKLQQHGGQLVRAAVELVKDWRTDRRYGKLEALLAVADAETSLIISGNGDIIEPDDGIIAIGSGGSYALSAARALLAHTDLDARTVATEALNIAGDICIYTNRNVVVEEL